MSLPIPRAPDHEISDGALAERAAAGDERAFEALDRRHRSLLLRHCTHVLRNGHDAEEAVQGALLKAYRAFSRGRAPDAVLPWLVTIARNECFDMIRARRSTEELPLEIASDEIRPDDLMVRREDARALRSDIAELPEAQRTALVLRVMGDLPHAEIAERLGGTPADARTLCHEARLSLAEFEEGRELACSAVLERIETGDGRALRARRIRAHLRACEGCRTAAEAIRPPARSRLAALGALFPLPSLGALRALLAGGGPAGAAGGIGASAAIGGAIAVVASALVVGVSMHTGDPAPPRPQPSPAVTSAARSAQPLIAPARTPRTTPPAASATPAAPAAAPRTAPAPAADPAPAAPAGGAVASILAPLVDVPVAPVTVPAPALPLRLPAVPVVPDAGAAVTDLVPGIAPAIPAVPEVPALTP